ncbi:MAG: glycosyltransferase family 2 protein [Candidatus Taylorbacteria bacterium]|nr:glycosyltransferase family 2 protein [Candidatus Taylorbacteria bacterium]
MKRLSIIIPVFNERAIVALAVKRVLAVELPGIEKEVIIVDDGSTDGTGAVLDSLAHSATIFRLEKNQGKGAALRRGFAEATGDFVIIQDADLEYDPKDYPLMLEPLLDGRADVVYGSRFMGHRPHRVLLFWHYVGNKVLTTFSNMLTDLNLSDIETCYKAFTKNALASFKDDLSSNRFGIEPELTARIAKKRLRIYEVGISYSGRTYAEGKKVGWKDGFSALWCIIRFNIFS